MNADLQTDLAALLERWSRQTEAFRQAKRESKNIDEECVAIVRMKTIICCHGELSDLLARHETPLTPPPKVAEKLNS